MHGYIVSINSIDVEEKHVLSIFGRLKDGRSFVACVDFVLYYYILKSSLDVAKKVLSDISCQFVRSSFKDFVDNSVVRIEFLTKKEFTESIKLLRDAQVKMFEEDIRPDFRFLLDHDIYSVIDIEGKEVDDEFCDVRFVSPVIIAKQMKPQEVVKAFDLSVLSVDIETTRAADKILSVALYDKVKNVSEVIVIHKGPLKHATCVKDEYALLEMFFMRIREIDPDVLVGWNFVDFDLSVIRKRAQDLGIPFCLGRVQEESRLRIESSFFKDSRAYVIGRQVIDGIWLLKHSFVELEDYKLDTAAKTFLGNEKLKDNGAAIAPRIQEYLQTDPQMVVDYNLLDAQLVIDVFDKIGVFDLAIARCVTNGLFLSEVHLSIKSLDSLYIRELVKKQKVSPSNAMSLREYNVMGGYVKEPNAGLYDNVVLLDFKSLYPSVIRTFNIDPLSYIEGKDYALTSIEAKEQGVVLLFNGARFKKGEGVLPSIITRVFNQRELAKKNKDALSSQAFKILLLSLWGSIASSSSRFFSLEIANAITGTCQKMIKLTAQRIEEYYGLEIIYGDTDSVFVKTNETELQRVRALGEKITTETNKFLFEYIKREYGQESKLELEFEKIYLKYFIPHARGSEEGSKKRYAGWVVFPDGSKKIDFVGLEYVRSDATALVKNFQYHLIEKLFFGEEIEAYIRGFVADLRAGKFDEQLVYKKSLRKPISEYTKTTPPHVKAAKKIPGGPVGRSIRYYITVDGPEPIEHFTSSIDYAHYIDKQIKPVAQSVLGVLGKDINEVLSDKKQRSLFDF